MYILLDSDNAIFENQGENNNLIRSATPIQIYPPDLEPVGINTSPSGSSGGPFTVSWSTLNSGTGDVVSGNWVDRVYLSLDPTLDINTAITLGSVSQSRTVLSGAPYSDEITDNLPNGLSGDYYVYVFVDADNAIFENQGEGNNVIQKFNNNTHRTKSVGRPSTIDY